MTGRERAAENARRERERAGGYAVMLSNALFYMREAAGRFHDQATRDELLSLVMATGVVDALHKAAALRAAALNSERPS